MRKIGLPWLAAGLALALMLAGCGRSRADPVGGIRTVHVTIQWTRFHPALFSFPEGTTVRFVIKNADPIEHEFILGSKRVQDHVEHTAHLAHDGSVQGQITVPPGTIRTTTYTFGRPGGVLLGCHLLGHYAYGMKGAVTITV
jgi:uncharacterized cupredoxin-like copper-binding protein